MPKDYIQDLEQITMYSKIGRYISNKLLKYRSADKKNSVMTERPSFREQSQVKSKMSMTTPGFNKVNSAMIASVSSHQKISQTNNQKRKKLKKGPLQKDEKQNNLQNQHKDELRSNVIKGKQNQFHPSVGHYKVNYTLTQKNPHLYDFNRSVPHFYNQNKKFNQTTSVLKQYPDGFFKNSRGFKQLKRMAGRQDIKGSIRKNLENPHQNRYVLHEDFNSIDKKKSPIKMDRMSPRDDRMFKNMEGSPTYDFNFQVNKKRLASHLVPFERQTQRKGEMFLAKTGISQEFMNYQNMQDSYRSVLWKKVLNREKNGLVPSYLDKTIHSRLAISMSNFKTLQLNCSDMKTTFRSTKHNDSSKSKLSKKEQQFVYVQENE